MVNRNNIFIQNVWKQGRWRRESQSWNLLRQSTPFIATLPVSITMFKVYARISGEIRSTGQLCQTSVLSAKCSPSDPAAFFSNPDHWQPYSPLCLGKITDTRLADGTKAKSNGSLLEKKWVSWFFTKEKCGWCCQLPSSLLWVAGPALWILQTWSQNPAPWGQWDLEGSLSNSTNTDSPYLAVTLTCMGKRTLFYP